MYSRHGAKWAPDWTALLDHLVLRSSGVQKVGNYDGLTPEISCCVELQDSPHFDPDFGSTALLQTSTPISFYLQLFSRVENLSLCVLALTLAFYATIVSNFRAKFLDMA